MTTLRMGYTILLEPWCFGVPEHIMDRASKGGEELPAVSEEARGAGALNLEDFK